MISTLIAVLRVATVWLVSSKWRQLRCPDEGSFVSGQHVPGAASGIWRSVREGFAVDPGTLYRLRGVVVAIFSFQIITILLETKANATITLLPKDRTCIA